MVQPPEDTVSQFLPQLLVKNMKSTQEVESSSCRYIKNFPAEGKDFTSRRESVEDRPEVYLPSYFKRERCWWGQRAKEKDKAEHNCLLQTVS